MRWFNIMWFLLLAACAQQRVITFNAKPPDATIVIDGETPKPQGFTQEITFKSADETHTATASRSGYKDMTVTLTRDNPVTTVDLDLKPVSRKVSFTVKPVPAVISIDNTTVSPDELGEFSKDLEFYKDSKDNWLPHTIRAQRPGFQPAVKEINYDDPSPDYVLDMQAMRKDISITTTPAGASVTVDNRPISEVTPVTIGNLSFPFNTYTNEYQGIKVVVSKPGRDPVTRMISWDNGQNDYHIDIPPKTKEIHFNTVPAGATVVLDGHVLPLNSIGQPTYQLSFPPINENGALPTFMATISKKTAETEWYPQTVQIGWDDGKADYSLTLKEIKTRLVPLTSLSLERNSDGAWELSPRQTETVAMKSTSEPGRESPQRIYEALPGTSIGDLAVSPDGSQILFTVLSGHSKGDFRSEILTKAADGTGGTQQLTDGKALDVMPSFTPDGDSIVFSSNRAGKRLSIWQKPVNGTPGLTQLTNGDEEDLWPMIDAAPGPNPRLFYEALVDSRPDSLLYMTRIGTTIRMDLTTIPVSQPRISPKADAVVFTSVNEKSGNREIYKQPDKGGAPINLTNDPDADCYDPVWSKDGNMIAYVCDRGVDEDHRRNADIWVMDLGHPEKPVQLTINGSMDDSPVWDATGSFIYFRSNRGGSWGVWKIPVK